MAGLICPDPTTRVLIDDLTDPFDLPDLANLPDQVLCSTWNITPWSDPDGSVS